MFKFLSPDQRKQLAYKWLGLSPQEVRVTKTMRSVTPEVWALKTLKLDPVKYRKIVQKMYSTPDEEREEFTDVIQERKGKEVAQIEKFGSLRSLLRQTANYWYATKQNYNTDIWRCVEPIDHMVELQKRINNIIQREQMMPHELFDLIILLYYTVYNATHGVRIPDTE